MTRAGQYTDAVLTSIQRIFGKGFLSPGGAGEVARIMDGIDLSEARVLDLGCGLGGVTAVLASELDAGHVTAVDIEPNNLAIARAAAVEAGLADRTMFELITPGPLPFPDDSFELIFCKAVICHIEDKPAFFREPRRVLRSGGIFAGADWIRGSDGDLSDAYQAFERELENAGLEFHFETAQAHERAFRDAGFERVEFQNVSPGTHHESVETVRLVEGDARDELTAAMGEEGYDSFLARCRARVDALANGDLQYHYFRAG